jgi:hypothetical protein
MNYQNTLNENYLDRCKPERTSAACNLMDKEASSRSTSSAFAFASLPFWLLIGVVTCSTNPISRSAAVLNDRRCLAPIPKAEIETTARAIDKASAS